ncbi:MAG: DEAD/DEAH box helicase family protein [Candidatus Pacebacteria bacterium]|nr:DEAD/DEAH box helicase family protein [Candidatus Paceibacterota bacterium]MCF7857627.1 DEAD/DEAH box helicase family protein [Candidatus Paceibacterota bacterium]
MTFNQILDKYRGDSFSQRDKGDRFERLMQSYLMTDPKYAYQIEKTWMWDEFPHRTEFGGHDIGIDLVAQTKDGDYWAIQCKCFEKDARISKAEVDTFLSTSGRSFKDGEGVSVEFKQRLWISTTNNWSAKAEETLINQNPPVIRLNLSELQESPVDWEKIDKGIFGQKARSIGKELRSHQKEALIKTIEHYREADRGKLIMACGTGKTFTSLRIAEEVAGQNGLVLFLVPSIALLGQTLREWTADSKEPINPICICSDSKVTRKKEKSEDTGIDSVVDLALPASTNVESIIKQFEYLEMTSKPGLTIVFSTYQSIDVISKTQKRLKSIGSKYASFDLIVCDEAHRTTGVTLVDEDESTFVKVHDNNFLESRKRLYMTATPRLYGEESKTKAEQSNAILCSMDNEELYGGEMYRIGFGEAVERDLLSDYKVLILTLSEDDITSEVQTMIKDESNEIGIDDISKLIGCVNAMSKQILGDKGLLEKNDPDPMRRAVAFCQSIKVSKKITDTFNVASDTYVGSLPELKKQHMVNLKSDHIDGSMSATQRDQLMSWLKEEPQDPKESRVLTNVRCLSEGVDVPSLDAVMFLSARNSQVDVVQSVGRVMRKSEGKKYGYIIIPVVVPSDIEPEKALDDNNRYKVVWTVLNALRAHDDRFNAIVNKIDFNKKRPEQILVGRVDPDGDGDPTNDTEKSKKGLEEATVQTRMRFDELQNVIYAKMVQKVGDRRYWEQWARSVADIAERQIKRITKLVNEEGSHKVAFAEFLTGLRKNINPSITQQQAIEMLSQHIITKPVFEALFEGYSFVKNNAVSVSMQQMLETIEAQAVEKEDVELLESFYNSVRKRAEGIDNAEGKQKIIIELYDKFFKTGFPKMVEQLGIVYTPLEVVDFIIHSVNDVLKKEFGRSLSDKNVNILDPFTGTGTFITRLLQTGVISPQDLERKYKNEIFANEIVLLAYYIAAVNIENAYHDLVGKAEYESFEGIALTDTFQLNENQDAKLFSTALAENSERVERQKNTPLQVIIGNPPYSVGQQTANDNAQNQKYERLESRIEETYVKESTASLRNALYDSYIKAFRWSSDRLSDDGGVIGFVSNGSWLDGNSQGGLRKSLEKEFSTIYVFNLRGNQRTQGELSRREGGKIFDSGSRNTISITLLVKNPAHKKEKADIYYHDIGDYLDRKTKLKTISHFKTIVNPEMELTKLDPNEHGDWINLRNSSFGSYIPLGDKKAKNQNTFFTNLYSSGVKTNRDAWAYGFSKERVAENMKETIKIYNDELAKFTDKTKNVPSAKADDFIDFTNPMITWTREIKWDLEKGKRYKYEPDCIVTALHRPFVKENLYFNKGWNNTQYLIPKLFPNKSLTNKVICVSGVGSKNTFSVLMTNHIPDLQLQFNGQCFPLYSYEEITINQEGLFDDGNKQNYNRRDGVSDFIWKETKKRYGSEVTKEDIFYYVYALLHSRDYKLEFANDLQKMLPRLPLVKKKDDFWTFAKAGRELAELHVNYEDVPPFEGVKISGTQHNDYRVDKIKFLNKEKKDTLIYNNHIKIENIPDEAHEYVLNGRSAIEWIMERYQVKIDKNSGILNDPNDWAIETRNQRYILDLLLSVINLSVRTVGIVNSLPKLTFEQLETE